MGPGPEGGGSIPGKNGCTQKPEKPATLFGWAFVGAAAATDSARQIGYRDLNRRCVISPGLHFARQCYTSCKYLSRPPVACEDGVMAFRLLSMAVFLAA